MNDFKENDPVFDRIIESLDLKELFPGAVITSQPAMGGGEAWINVTVTAANLPHQSTFYGVCQRVIHFDEMIGTDRITSLAHRGAYPILIDGMTHELNYFKAPSYIWGKAIREGLTLTFRFEKNLTKEVQK